MSAGIATAQSDGLIFTHSDTRLGVHRQDKDKFCRALSSPVQGLLLVNDHTEEVGSKISLEVKATRANMLLRVVWGIFGEPWGLSQVMLVAASFCQEVPQLRMAPLHNFLFTSLKYRICSIHIGICFNLTPCHPGSHGSTGQLSLLHLKTSPPISGQRQAEEASVPRLSTLPKAQATSFGAQLPGTHSISEQGACLSLQLQGLCLSRDVPWG